jgi:ribosomal protein S13
MGRRFSGLTLKKAGVDMNKRAGELNKDEVDAICKVIADPAKYKIPRWFMNRRKDRKSGVFSHEVSNNLDMKLREDLERLKKIKCNRGMRHQWGVRVRGQHTKTTGRKGKTIGVSHKKQQ